MQNFIDNKYSGCYFSIIERARTQVYSGYTEKHHVLPKSLGGNNDNANIVRLSAREHYVCHLLLPRFTVGEARKKMIYARWCMSTKVANRHTKVRTRINITGRAYETARSELVEVLRNRSPKARTGWKHTDAAKQKIREAVLGNKNGRTLQSGQKYAHEIRAESRSKQSSPEHREKLRLAKLGKPRSEEAKQKIREGFARRKALQLRAG